MSGKRTRLTTIVVWVPLTLAACAVGWAADQNLHWSYRSLTPVTAPATDQTHDKMRAQNPIDLFTLEKQQENGIQPSPPASRSTLIRRLYLDLLGLLPSPEQVQRFTNDQRPDAYQRLVAELLSSPHFGERWGRHWLDQSLYADSEGFDLDLRRPHAWRYRQWVLDHVNADTPFDQFTVAQLAGDLLNAGTIEDLVATGFLRNVTHNIEAGVDQDEDHARQTMTQVNTLATVWMGLTMQCCSCHDHKYEDLSQKEYYQLYAFFRDMQPRSIEAPTDRQLAVFDELADEFETSHRPLADARKKYRDEVAPAKAIAWEKQLGPIPEAAFTPFKTAKAVDHRGADLTVQADHSILASGLLPFSSIYELQCQTDLRRLTAIQLELLTNDSLPNGGPGRDAIGNGEINRITIHMHSASQNNRRQLKLLNAQTNDTQDRRELDRMLAMDKPAEYRRQNPRWAIGERSGRNHIAVLELAEPIDVPEDAVFHIELLQGMSQDMRCIGCLRISGTDCSTPFRFTGCEKSIGDILAGGESARSASDNDHLINYFCSRDPGWHEVNQRVLSNLKFAPKNPYKTRARTVTNKPNDLPHVVFENGDFLSPGEEVQPDTPRILPPLNSRSAQPDRLDLARWLVSPEHPLTARVTVNRIWQHYFGRGIVRTDHDFGENGESPTHTKLLDWLASELIRSDWSCKHIHRLIVTSNTYRQSSKYRADLADSDVNNDWFAIQERLPQEAEVVRDIVLNAGGLLNKRMGGPSFVMSHATLTANPTNVFSKGPALTPTRGSDSLRRGVYAWFQRTNPNPTLKSFGIPDANQTCTRRQRSQTPVQALARLNEKTFYGSALALGRRIYESRSISTTLDERLDNDIHRLFKICMARPANADELIHLRSLQMDVMQYYRQNPGQTARIAKTLRLRPPTLESGCELAAWCIVAHTVLNLEEFLVRE